MWGTEPCSWTGSVGFEVGQPLEVCVCVCVCEIHRSLAIVTILRCRAPWH